MLTERKSENELGLSEESKPPKEVEERLQNTHSTRLNETINNSTEKYQQKGTKKRKKELKKKKNNNTHTHTHTYIYIYINK